METIDNCKILMVERLKEEIVSASQNLYIFLHFLSTTSF